MADNVLYPFDPTGQAPSNRITGEQIIITAPGSRRYHFTMPKMAPFFEEGLALKVRSTDGTITELQKGIDYYLSNQFKDASLATMHEIWGSITFLRRNIVGVLFADYNTLGGIWTVDSQKIIEILANQSRNPRTTTWEQIVERPVDFPVIDHPWNLDDMVGMREINQTLENFYQAFLLSIGTGGSGSGSRDALTLQGKSYNRIMLDVVGTKVNNASNADKVYGYDLSQLAGAIIDSKTYYDKLTYTTLQVDPSLITINYANDGGTLDPDYLYAMVGEFIIPGTEVPPFWDSAVQVVSSSLDIFMYWGEKTSRARLDITADKHPAGNSSLKYYSDTPLDGMVQFGMRKIISPYASANGTPAYFNQVWMKFKKSLLLKHYSIFQYNRNGFILRDPRINGFWDYSSNGVSAVIWQPQDDTGGGSQAAFDGLADVITSLIAQPAA